MQKTEMHTQAAPREDREAIEACRATVSSTFAGINALIDGWRLAVESAVTASAARIEVATMDELIERLVRDEFDGASLVVGAGFVAAPGFLLDSDWHLAWWLSDTNTFGVGKGKPTVRRLLAVEDPAADGFRDYTTLEWWRIPMENGLRHITGPYVDYLCTDDYSLTLTTPVTFEGKMVGLVGVDIYVVDLERVLMRPLKAIGRTATLVNGTGRVIASTDPHLATGALLRLAGLSEWLRETPEDTLAVGRLDDGRAVHRCAGTALALLFDD